MHNYAQQINWEDLHYALELAKSGSFLKVAEVLDVHHTTVSRRLDSLESKLGTKLFFRHNRGVSLTASGKSMLCNLKDLSENIEKIQLSILGLDNKLQGKLKITSLAPLIHIFDPYIFEFSSRYPEIDFEVILEERGLNLTKGEADISIRAGNKPQDGDYIPIKLADTFFALYGSESYLQKYGIPRNLDDLKKHKFVLLDNIKVVFPWQSWFNENITDPKSCYRTNRPEGILSAVNAGFGLGFISCFIAKDYPKLKMVLPAKDEWKSALWLVVHRERYQIPKIQEFMNFIKQIAKNELEAKISFRE